LQYLPSLLCPIIMYTVHQNHHSRNGEISLKEQQIGPNQAVGSLKGMWR